MTNERVSKVSTLRGSLLTAAHQFSVYLLHELEPKVTALLAAERQAAWLEAAQMLDSEADAILNAWEHDPEVPHTQHEPKDCHDRCDGYCIAQLTFSSLAARFRQQAYKAKLKEETS